MRRGSRRKTGLAAARLGAAAVMAMVMLALLAPWLSPYHTNTMDLARELEGPSSKHWMGTGDNGIDVLTHCLYGARVSLLVAVATTAISSVLGVLLGAFAGYHGGLLDDTLMRIVDVVLAFPGILLAIFITAVLGPAIEHVVLALAITGWVGYARLARGQVLALREREYVTAARAIGASDARIVLRHLLPNLLSPVVR